MDIGKEVMKARRKAGLTQKGLALKISTTANYISMIENNTRMPLINTLKRISEVTGEDLSILLGSATTEGPGE